MAVKIEGSCDPRFKRVREVFADSFENGIEVGAAVAAVVDGKTVFDLWGGYADKAKTKPWTRDTLVNVLSTTKGTHVDVRASAGRSGQARLRRAGVEVLARVCAGGQGKDSGKFSAHSSRGPGGRQEATADGRVLELAGDVRCAGGAGAVVGAGHGAGLSCAHVRLPGRRGDSANHGQDAGHLSARGNRGAAQARYPYRRRCEFRSADCGVDDGAAGTAGQARSTGDDERRSGIDDVQGDRESAAVRRSPHW